MCVHGHTETGRYTQCSGRGSLTPNVPLSRLRSIISPGGSSANDTTPAKPLLVQLTGPGTQGEAPQITDAEQGGAADQYFDEASFLGSLPGGDLRVKGAPSIFALPPADDGTWHPLVHDLAPVVLEALQSLELLFKAKRHPTGVAPWAVHMAWHGTWNGGHGTRSSRRVPCRKGLIGGPKR